MAAAGKAWSLSPTKSASNDTRQGFEPLRHGDRHQEWDVHGSVVLPV
jgi:hypothetical protein